MVTEDDVKRIHAAHVAYAASSGAPEGFKPRQSTRTEVHGLLQLASPAPGRDSVTDADRIASDVARDSDPNHVNAHHFIQKRHQMAQWAETERLVDAALGKAGL